MRTDQMSFWNSEFGKEYSLRNSFEDVESFNQLYIDRFGKTRDELNLAFLDHLDRDIRILEVGANIGNQLRALHRIGFNNLFGIELQRFCVEKAKELAPQADIIEGSALDIPFKDGYFDLVYTCDVLIHIAPDNLGAVMSEMHRVSKNAIWGFEYYAPEITEIPYHGNTNMLWKANYPLLFLERFNDLEIAKEEHYEYLNETGNTDVMYLLKKKQS
jgi:pseudaminic acid biosynthesis-associated methylase